MCWFVFCIQGLYFVCNSTITITENSITDEEGLGKRTFEMSEETLEEDEYENTEEFRKDTSYDWKDNESKHINVDISIYIILYI